MTLHLLVELVNSVPGPTSSPSPGPEGVSGATTPAWVPYLTLIAAVLAAGVAFFAAILQRRSGRESAAAARSSADAARKSSRASERSAKAAEDSVALNAETSRATAERLDSEALGKRFQDAASQLGNANAAVRLAGVYSLARLADDWPEQRQTCVNVLCALLRMRPQMRTYAEEHYPIELPDDGDQQVRRTVTDLISSRVTSGEALWAACDFDLTYAYLVDFRLRDATISGRFVMNGATIEQDCSFTRTVFGGGLDAQELRINGTFKLTDVLPGPGKTVSLTGSYIDEGATLDFVLSKPPPVAEQWAIWPTRVVCRGELILKVTKTTYEQATFHVPGLQLEPTARFRIIQTPASEGNSSNFPKIEAKGWSTTASSKIAIPGSMRGKHIFKASEWTGVPQPRFEYAYVTPRDSDAMLGLDDNDA